MILSPTTNKQLEILYLLYRFRFLNRVQIQQLLHHKDRRRINKWLKDLLIKKYIKRVDDTETKIIHDPFIYRLSSRSIHRLEIYPKCKPNYLKKIYKEGTLSESFRKQCMFIANIYLSLREKYDKTSFLFYTPSEYTPEGLIKEVSPHFVYRKEEKGSYYLVEFFREKAPDKALSTRIENYIKFFAESGWSKKELTPNLLLVCPNSAMEENITKTTLELLQEHNSFLKIFTSTAEKVKTSTIDGPVWKQVK